MVVENLEVASWWDLADSGWVPAVALIAIWALYKQRTVTEAFGKYFTANVVETNALT